MQFCQNDNASCHGVKNFKTFLKEIHNSMTWPANSPDLNMGKKIMVEIQKGSMTRLHPDLSTAIQERLNLIGEG